MCRSWNRVWPRVTRQTMDFGRTPQIRQVRLRRDKGLIQGHTVRVAEAGLSPAVDALNICSSHSREKKVDSYRRGKLATVLTAGLGVHYELRCDLRGAEAKGEA